MMAERQVVIVREAQDIPDLQKETGAKMLLDYLTKPSPTTVLVLCHKHKTLDKRKELGKKADQLALSLTFKKPYDSQLAEFISGYLEEKGFTMEDRGVLLLSEYVGNDLKRLSNEIDKLLVQAAKGDTISADAVMSTVGVSREYNIFELQKAIITKNHLQAAKIAHYFANNTRKNPLLPMIAFFYSFFSKLLIASASPQQDEKALISVLKISPYAVKDYSSALRNYSTQKIVQNIAHIKSADLKLKGFNSGSETEEQILKELIFQLMHTR
jgi:DNA polymerase III subunit delta